MISVNLHVKLRLEYLDLKDLNAPTRHHQHSRYCFSKIETRQEVAQCDPWKILGLPTLDLKVPL